MPHLPASMFVEPGEAPVGWELAREEYDCEGCGYPMDPGEKVYWCNGEPYCAPACAKQASADRCPDCNEPAPRHHPSCPTRV